MPKMLSVQVEDALVKSIDDFIKVSGLYSSRSEFLKDSIRANLLEKRLLDSDFKNVHLAAEKFRKESLAGGYSGKDFSREEKESNFKKFIKKNKL